MKKEAIDKKLIDVDVSAKIQDTIDVFNTNNEKTEEAIVTAFKKFPCNTSVSEVLIKVILVNEIYHTRIKSKDLLQVATHISEIKGLDQWLKVGDEEAYQQIANTPAGLDNIYSFASKYCSFSNPDKYPIVDKFARCVLRAIGQNEDFKELQKTTAYSSLLSGNNVKYSEYRETINAFIALVKKKCNEKYSYKDIDKFLWQYGVDNNIANE